MSGYKRWLYEQYVTRFAETTRERRVQDLKGTMLTRTLPE